MKETNKRSALSLLTYNSLLTDPSMEKCLFSMIMIISSLLDQIVYCSLFRLVFPTHLHHFRHFEYLYHENGNYFDWKLDFCFIFCCNMWRDMHSIFSCSFKQPWNCNRRKFDEYWWSGRFGDSSTNNKNVQKMRSSSKAQNIPLQKLWCLHRGLWPSLSMDF